jgi:hypothetical protein
MTQATTVLQQLTCLPKLSLRIQYFAVTKLPVTNSDTPVCNSTHIQFYTDCTSICFLWILNYKLICDSEEEVTNLIKNYFQNIFGKTNEQLRNK